MPHQSSDIRHIAATLCNALPSSLVASLSGKTDRQLPERWAEEDGPFPDTASTNRLEIAYWAFNAISARDGVAAAQRFLMSPNPRLGGHSPIKAIREDRFADVRAAATAALEDAWDG